MEDKADNIAIKYCPFFFELRKPYRASGRALQVLSMCDYRKIRTSYKERDTWYTCAVWTKINLFHFFYVEISIGDKEKQKQQQLIWLLIDTCTVTG